MRSIIALDDRSLQVLGESIHFLREVSAQAAEMAQQLQDIHSRTDRGESSCVLHEESVVSLRDQTLRVRTELSNTAELIPEIHTSLDVPWVGEKRHQLRLAYLSGDDPWDFCLSYSNDQKKLQKIEGTIKEKYSEGLLEKCAPKVGEFVVCHQLAQGQHKYFRAFITKYYPKLKKGVHVYKLDTGDRTVVFPDDVYYVPTDIVFIPSRVIKCCLFFGECGQEETFCPELRLAFKDALEKSTLTVDILDKANDSEKAEPPRFSAIVWLFEENRCGADVNLNYWITGKVIPRLKEISQGRSDIFEELDILDPFYAYESEREIEANAAVEAEYRMIDEKTAQDDVHLAATSTGIAENRNAVQVNCVTSSTPVKMDDPAAEHVAASLEKVAEWINGGSYGRVKLPTPEPVVEPTFLARKKAVKNEPKIDEQLSHPAQVTLSKHKRPAIESTDVSSASSQTTEAQPDQPPPHKPARSKYKKSDNASYRSPSKPEDKENGVPSTKQLTLSARAPVFVPSPAIVPVFEPKCLVQITKNGNEEDDYDGVITNLQEEYQPKDEKRLCLFYQKNGYCRRKLCTREHVEKSSVWTTDKIDTYCHTFNDVDLPKEGSEVVLKIQHIKGPVSFYATLPDSYSDTGEPGVLETSRTLHDDLNSQDNNNTHPLLPAGPQLGELVVALGYQECLGPRKKWLRARVLKVLDDAHVEVFFLDFGNQEVVKTKDLRQMRPQFLHLPAQAVLTTLYSLSPNPEKREVAVKLLKESIERKELNAKIIYRYDGELEVLLFTENGDSLNDILVQQSLANVRM